MNKIVVANWKMSANRELVELLVTDLKRALFHFDVDLIICPSFVHIPLIQAKLKHNREILYGAQDASAYSVGAHTGDVSAAMLKELGCHYVILGHSERRAFDHETNSIVAEKVKRVLEQGMTPIVCFGETLPQREAGLTEDILHEQLIAVLPSFKKGVPVLFAYEPVWAIGAGQAARLDDIMKAHAFLREGLKHYPDAKILYGGSVNAENALDIVGTPGVDGLLVGSASLKSDELITICRAAHQYSDN